MNLFSLIMYIFICSMFITTLLGNLATSQVQRQRFIALFFVQGIIFLGIFVVFGWTTDYPALLPIHFLAFGVAVPQLIGRVILQKRMREPKFQLQIDRFIFTTATIGMVFMFLLTIGSLLPSRISYPDGKPILDTEYFVSRISFLLAFIPVIVLFFMLARQRTIFYSEGLLYNGLLLAWSDFQAYSWRKRKEVLEIYLVPIKSLWFVKGIKLMIPAEHFDEIEIFLAQRLKQGVGAV